MKRDIHQLLLKDYENMRAVYYDQMPEEFRLVDYETLDQEDVPGVLKANILTADGRLKGVYTSQEQHVGVIAATRLGKTTSYVIPTILSFAKRRNRRSMIISDPKGELYKITSGELRKRGYDVKLLNFRDYTHSEYWNLLTDIFRQYQNAYHVYDEVEVVTVDGVLYNRFRGKVYKSQQELDADLGMNFTIEMSRVKKNIDEVAQTFLVRESLTDPYWEDAARDVLKSFLYAMLEDSRPEFLALKKGGKLGTKLITEETFSFNTILSILDEFEDNDTLDDKGYFTNRPNDAESYRLAKNNLIANATNTRRCILSCLMSKISMFRDSSMRMITACNSFDMNVLAGERPLALYINYRDELKVHYNMIALFIQEAYRFLIQTANQRISGQLETPFYFILDEFANMPPLKDFDSVISACAGRNIFFILIIQSYAQLDAVYGPNVATIIRDNLNMHIFMGSNNPETLREFSRECGEITRLSPLSALNGDTDEIRQYQIETIPLVPVSRLSGFFPGECIITEANSGYTFFSKLERYYNCEQLKPAAWEKIEEYHSDVNVFAPKYMYTSYQEKPSEEPQEKRKETFQKSVFQLIAQWKSFSIPMLQAQLHTGYYETRNFIRRLIRDRIVVFRYGILFQYNRSDTGSQEYVRWKADQVVRKCFG